MSNQNILQIYAPVICFEMNAAWKERSHKDKVDIEVVRKCSELKKWLGICGMQNKEILDVNVRLEVCQGSRHLSP